MALPPNIAALDARDLDTPAGIARPVGALAAGVQAALAGGITRANMAGRIVDFEVALPADWVRPALAAGASEPNAALPLRWRKTAAGEVEGIGVGQVSGADQPVYTLPWRPIQDLGFLTRQSGGSTVANLSILTSGAVTIGTAALAVHVAFRFTPTDRSPRAPSPPWPRVVQLSPRRVVSEVQVLRAVDLDLGAPGLAALAVEWGQDRDSLQIRNVVGLHPGRRYRLKLFVSWEVA
jgi:hypothetical protein